MDATHHDVAISNLYGCPQVNTIAICLPFYLSIVYQSQRIAFALACCLLLLPPLCRFRTPWLRLGREAVVAAIFPTKDRRRESHVITLLWMVVGVCVYCEMVKLYVFT